MGTSLTLNADGTFSGSYHDTDAGVTDYCPQCTGGVVHVSVFTGKFSHVKKVSDYEYKATIESIQLEKPVNSEELVHSKPGYAAMHIYSAPYGVTDRDGKRAIGKEVTFYLPGRNTSDFSTVCEGESPSWFPGRANFVPGETLQKPLFYVTETCNAFIG